MIWKNETIIIRYLAHELLEFYLLKKNNEKVSHSLAGKAVRHGGREDQLQCYRRRKVK